jgi:hypothetical protein
MTVVQSRLRPMRVCLGCGISQRMLSAYCGDCEELEREKWAEDEDYGRDFETEAEERAERMERRYESS